MAFHRWLTGQHQAVCDAISHFTSTNHHVLEEDSAQTPLWDAMVHDTVIHSVPRGNVKHQRTSQGRRGRTKPILRRTGHLTREVTSGVNNLHSEHFMVPGAQNFHSARSTGLYKSARGTSKSSYCRHGVGSIQIRKAFHFMPQPHSTLELGHYSFNYFYH